MPSQEHGVIDTSSSLEPTFANAHSELRQVDVTTLDGFLRQSDYSSAAVTLLKIDVEGHEAAVLRGAIETIRRWRPAIFIEILPRAEMDFLSRLCIDLDYLDFPLAIDHPPPPSELVAFHPDAWNHAFVPAEKLALFVELTATILPDGSTGSRSTGR